MKKKALEQKSSPNSKHIKVKLDHRTFIMLPSMASLKMWIKRYPEAKVITA